MLEFSLQKKYGDAVKVGEIFGYIYTNDDIKSAKSVQNFKDAYIISNNRIRNKGRIVANI